MPRKKVGEPATTKWPEAEPGNWKGEFAKRPSGSIGHHVQPGPPQMSVEFTYLICGAVVISPAKMEWPAVISFWVRTPFTPERIEAGFIFRSGNMPSFNLGLEVTRPQFTEMLWLFKEKMLTNFHFTVAQGANDHRPITAWGASFEL
ncbi:hypothetical protein GGE35_002947 [Rhizobium cellulosilyticum]|uniref:Uncharacterized protein n=1 Tax=Aliirhizobium cellulosilyticum TaxID=393664 RepID=A0A7W6TGX5_9HYPH|nr:hypothetical protein [Rhizobium cellulosilyticum]MBB4412493.1 hypothetical protein [Rhizobium cellulosilyticum]MBB4447125.1 hypothetical protein [Rhizobium cellulosilyticum]